MPQVGSKKFAYTPKGREQASKYAKKTGQKIEVGQPKGKTSSMSRTAKKGRD